MMNDPKIIEIIANLKGRRNYEEKKASKLGFASLYEYIEDKVTNGPSSKPAKKKKSHAGKRTQKGSPTQTDDVCGCC